MAAIINVTPQQPVLLGPGVTGGVKAQPAYDAIDVSGYDILDLELVITTITGFTSGTIAIMTGMQMQSDDGWVTLANFSLAGSYGTAGNAILKTYDKGFLRYIRWIVMNLSPGDQIGFYIRGMARRYGNG